MVSLSSAPRSIWLPSQFQQVTRWRCGKQETVVWTAKPNICSNHAGQLASDGGCTSAETPAMLVLCLQGARGKPLPCIDGEKKLYMKIITVEQRSNHSKQRPHLPLKAVLILLCLPFVDAPLLSALRFSFENTCTPVNYFSLASKSSRWLAPNGMCQHDGRCTPCCLLFFFCDIQKEETSIWEGKFPLFTTKGVFFNSMFCGDSCVKVTATVGLTKSTCVVTVVYCGLTCIEGQTAEQNKSCNLEDFISRAVTLPTTTIWSHRLAFCSL